MPGRGLIQAGAALAGLGYAALTHSLWWEVALLAATLALTPLLPARAGTTPLRPAAVTPD